MLRRDLIKVIVLLLLPMLLLVACASNASPSPSPKRKTYSSPPKMIIDQNKSYTATIETKYGNLVLELFAKDVPVAVNNFVFLARDGFYDGLTFHRVIADFMAQGGDPLGAGGGGGLWGASAGRADRGGAGAFPSHAARISQSAGPGD